MGYLRISLDQKLKDEIDRLSKEDGVSKSVIIRKLIKQASWERNWRDVSKQIRTRLNELNLNTIDEIEKFVG